MGFKKLSLSGIVLLLAACGGSDSDESNNFLPEPPEPATGVLQTGPVANVDYTTATGSRSGVTNASGEFQYVPGDNLTFAIGDLAFPSVKAAAVITAMNMGNTRDISADRVTNIVRLLMTLDQDGNPENGITITDTAKAVASQIDFELPADEFAASDAVTSLIFNAGQDQVVSGLVSMEDAIAWFEAELIANDIPYGTVAQHNDQAIRDYLEDNGLTAIADESGMYYQIITEGTGDSPTASSTVEVRYKGSLLDGTVFDQTVGEDTATFNLGGLISGWSIALPLLKPGGKGVFYLPSALGYGPSGSGGVIPPDAVLIFEIELIDFE